MNGHHGPAVQHRERYPVFCDDLCGKESEGDGRVDMYTWTALLYSRNDRSLVNQPHFKKTLKKWIKKKPFYSGLLFQWHTINYRLKIKRRRCRRRVPLIQQRENLTTDEPKKTKDELRVYVPPGQAFQPNRTAELNHKLGCYIIAFSFRISQDQFIWSDSAASEDEACNLQRFLHNCDLISIHGEAPETRGTWRERRGPPIWWTAGTKPTARVFPHLLHRLLGGKMLRTAKRTCSTKHQVSAGVRTGVQAWVPRGLGSALEGAEKRPGKKPTVGFVKLTWPGSRFLLLLPSEGCSLQQSKCCFEKTCKLVFFSELEQKKVPSPLSLGGQGRSGEKLRAGGGSPKAGTPLEL